jgi:hypothetical protein
VTESDWQACTDPKKMLDFLACTDPKTLLPFSFDPDGERKQRLFACACLRRVWPLLWDERLCSAVILLERYAEGDVGGSDRKAARRAAQAVQQTEQTVVHNRVASAVFVLGERLPDRAAREASRLAAEAAAASCTEWLSNDCWAAVRAERSIQAGLLRCIFGSLAFRPVALDPNWLTWHDGLIRHLAQAAYDERQLPSGHLDPHRLAVLADALEEAGCDNPEILGHLRQPGAVHVRGCHVVDLLLAKE